MKTKKKEKEKNEIKVIKWATSKCKCLYYNNCKCKRVIYKYTTNEKVSKCFFCRKYSMFDGVCKNDFCPTNSD